ncbi:acyl-CoA dehydrogenase C-terminal domain-containing protein [Kitasatospora sp. NPDC018058]|uniref:acyl-CoA dehydrogenase C-terminal domain-containing protein n=1 Tax=Kitasatospora sp. NPDC018058 TaxID=3364025 RepID=UPI0037BF5824
MRPGETSPATPAGGGQLRELADRRLAQQSTPAPAPATASKPAEAKGVGGEAAELAARLEQAADRIGRTIVRFWSTGDPATALVNASTYLEAVGHVVLAWSRLEQFLALGEGADAFREGKRPAARYFFRGELPCTGVQFDLLDSLDRTATDCRP